MLVGLESREGGGEDMAMSMAESAEVGECSLVVVLIARGFISLELNESISGRRWYSCTDLDLRYRYNHSGINSLFQRTGNTE